MNKGHWSNWLRRDIKSSMKSRIAFALRCVEGSIQDGDHLGGLYVAENELRLLESQIDELIKKKGIPHD